VLLNCGCGAAVIEHNPELAAALEGKWEKVLELLERGGISPHIPEHDKEYKYDSVAAFLDYT